MIADDLLWFKLLVIYSVNNGFNNDEEVSEVEQIRLNNEGLSADFETDYAFYNLAKDPIIQLNPKCFVPKGKTNKKYITEIIFLSGNLAYGVGKPEFVYEKLNEYLATLPK